MTVEDLAQRHTGSSEEVASYLENLLAVKRIFPAMISGQERLACMDDAARLRDALGVRLPESLPEIYLHRVSYPLRDLFLRYLRAHALVTAEQLAHEFSLGIAIVEEQLQQLREQGLVMNLQQDIWVSDEVFRRLRLRSLQAAREATRPVAATTYARLLLERQGVLPATDGSPALFASTSPGVYEGVDGVMRVIEQLAGVGLPASLWESQILPARVRDYSSEMLDELLATGAVIWSGQKKLGEDDGLVALHLHEYAAESFTPAEADQANRSALQQAIVAVLADGGAWFAQQISQRIRDKIGESVDLCPARGVMGAGLARRHHQRHLGTVTRPHPQQFQRTHLNSPQSPGSSWTSCLCATRLAAGILQHTKSGWTLVVIAGGATKRYRKDAGAGGKYARPLRHHQSSGGDSRKYPWRVSIDANALSKYGRLRANYARSFCRRSGWRAIR